MTLKCMIRKEHTHPFCANGAHDMGHQGLVGGLLCPETERTVALSQDGHGTMGAEPAEWLGSFYCCTGQHFHRLTHHSPAVFFFLDSRTCFWFTISTWAQVVAL